MEGTGESTQQYGIAYHPEGQGGRIGHLRASRYSIFRRSLAGRVRCVTGGDEYTAVPCETISTAPEQPRRSPGPLPAPVQP